jgi:hypothetical protein
VPAKAPFCFSDAGMRNFSSIEVMAHAARIRAAKKTCSRWKEDYEALEKARLEFGPLINLSRGSHEKRDNHWWETRAFADNLVSADSYPIKHIVKKVASNRRCSLQAQVARELLPKYVGSDLAEILQPRLLRFLAPLAFSAEYLVQQMRLAMKISKTLPPSIALALVKVWCNAWTTDSRVGGGVSDCRFGCAHSDIKAKDRLVHYLDCPRLWTPLMAIASKRLGVTWQPNR